MLDDKCIILDLDGTLCDIDHRVDYAQAGDWDKFHSLCIDDKPRPDVLTFLNLVASRCRIVALTGRNERFRDLTLHWLQRHSVIVDDLLMRPNEDYTPDNEMKIILIEKLFGTKEEALKNILFALDDRDRVVEAFRNYGIPTWQVKEGAF